MGWKWLSGIPVLSFFLSFFIFAGTSTAFPSDPRLVYLGLSNINELTPADLLRLQNLRTKGMNILILPIGNQPLSTTIATIRGNPILSQFKYVLSFGWLIDNQCLRLGTCSNLAKSGFGIQLQQNLTGPINTVMSNSDLFVGYYSYDEPMTGRISAEAQLFTYSFIRQLDPDIVNRPVISAHANWIIDRVPSLKDGEKPNPLRIPTDQEIAAYMHPNAQDIFMSSQYAWDMETQARWIGALNRLGFFNKPFIQIVPSFSSAAGGCSYRNLVRFNKNIRTALNDVGQLSKLSGFGYFSYWKAERGADWTYDLANCDPLVDSTIEQLQSDARIADSRFAPEVTSWVNEYWQPIQFNNAIPTATGGSITEVRNVALSGGDFIGQGVRLIPPSAPTGMVKALFPQITLSSSVSSYFITQMGFEAGAECGNGVRVQLLVTDFSANGAWSIRHMIDLDRGQGKVPFIVDLTPWVGHNVGLGLLVSSKGDANCDRFVLEHPRLTTIARRANPYAQAVPTDPSILHPFTAQWSNDQLQTVSFDFNFPANPAIGFGLPDSGFVASGATAQNGGVEILGGFDMFPPQRSNSFTKAVFTPRQVSSLGNTFFVAEVGLGYNPECGDGVTVEAVTKDLVTGYKKVQGRKAIARLSGISQFYANLESTRGHQMEFQLIAKSNANANCDQVMIGNPRIINFVE